MLNNLLLAVCRGYYKNITKTGTTFSPLRVLKELKLLATLSTSMLIIAAIQLLHTFGLCLYLSSSCSTCFYTTEEDC